MSDRIVLLFLLYFTPAIPLAIAWSKLVRAKRQYDLAVLLVIVSLSFIWIPAGVIFPMVLGPYYSYTRYSIIGWNFGVMALVAVLLLAKKPRHVDAATAAILTALVWLWLAVINSIV
jgi:hypothetical protein